LIGALASREENKSYSYRIFKKQPITGVIGTLTELLGFATDKEAFAFLQEAGLCRNTRFGYGLVTKNWEMIETTLAGFFFIKRYGKGNQHLFTIGEAKNVIKYQIYEEVKPPVFPQDVLESARRLIRNSSSSSSSSTSSSGDNTLATPAPTPTAAATT